DALESLFRATHATIPQAEVRSVIGDGPIRATPGHYIVVFTIIRLPQRSRLPRADSRIIHGAKRPPVGVVRHNPPRPSLPSWV
ncbi:hypothetical protein AVEN_35009-1, partial [Araneus ventricosus]